MRAVYFDNNATTPLDSRVREAMLPWLGTTHGNPSSVHAFGRAAQQAVETARHQVAGLIGARPGDLVFMSSGTEANNAVVFSRAKDRPEGHIVLSALEHPSVHAAADRLQSRGWSVSRAKPDARGVIEPGRIFELLREDTALVCVMLANNEIGTMQPVAEVSRECRTRGVPVLCDAVQAVGKIPVDVDDLDVDFVTIGAHKFHGPLGAAALWIRPGQTLEPLLVGGGQERYKRAGTENVAALVGFGTAAELAWSELSERGRRLAELRDRFEARVSQVAPVEIHGAEAERLPNTSNLAFPGLTAESLMIRLDLRGYAVSAGAACSSGKVEPSVTLAAMGVGEQEASSSIRVSFGITNSADEVDGLIDTLEEEIPRLVAALQEST